MFKILNKASDIEIAVITATILELRKNKEEKKRKKYSNWIISSRISKENLLNSSSIWKKSIF